MLHNSIFRRDMLREMNANPLMLRRRDVHRNVAPRAGAKAGAGEMLMQGAWAVRSSRGHAAEKAVADDAGDFLKRMGVEIDPSAKNEVLLEIGSAKSGFRCVSSPTRLEVHAANASALWAGWVHIENHMRSGGGPIVAGSEIRREPAWDVQIAPPTWGANYAVPDLSPEYVGDDTFRSLAHAGADGMFIYGDFLLYATGTRFDELNHSAAGKHLAMLREATQRAGAYGVKLYFVAVSPKLPAEHALFKRLPEVRGAKLAHHAAAGALHCLCSSSDEALGFHGDVFGRMFKEAPDLGGVILIIGGESYYHCFMRAAESKIGETNCEKCQGKVAEDVIARLLKVTADAIGSTTPQAAVLAWPYSAQYFWSKEPNQLELIDRLPESVALLSEIDKEQIVKRGGVTKRIWDYSVDYDDHSDRIVAQAMRCAKRQRKLFVKTETSHGIELLHLPYVPALGRSAKQWQSVRAMRPAGVLQRWGFIGMYDSAAERIGYQARWNPDFTPDSATLEVARQLVGDAAPQVVAAWKHFDESVHHIPVLTTGQYYCGPCFLGPAHPLPVWDPKGSIPQAFHGNLYYLLEGEATGTDVSKNPKSDMTLTSTRQMGIFGDEGAATAIEAEFALARDASAKGHALLQAIKPDGMSQTVREELIEQQAIGEYLYRTFRATVNTLHFVRRIEEVAGEREKIRPELNQIAADELENARAARKVYEVAPWLNHKLRLDVGVNDSLVMMDEKIRLLEGYLKA
jgi:hypothetical protein